MAAIEFALALSDGRTLHCYDTGPAELTVVWHHGTPQTGPPPPPLVMLPGVRWLSVDRPGYGGSTPRPGRSVADAAADTAALADAVGVDRMAPSAHSARLAAHLPAAELDLRPADGHLSIFSAAASAVDRLR